MTLILLVIAGLLWVKAVWLGSLRLSASPISHFELQRRAINSHKARNELWRNETLHDVRALRRVIVVILLVAISALSIGALGWLWGVAVACLAGIVYVGLSGRPFVGRFADKLYAPYELRVLNAVEKAHIFIRPFRAYYQDDLRRIDSREHLAYLVESSEEVFSDEQRKLIVHAMSFSDTPVSSVMTPKKDIKTVEKTEFLGPLVLDELHGYGHSHLPVIAKDVHHIVGVLDVRGLLSLDVTRSTTAQKAMDKKVITIKPDDSLEDALSLFLNSHQHICIVKDDDGETVGLLTLSDVIAALIGRRITKKL